jgi:hypothetical protein
MVLAIKIIWFGEFEMPLREQDFLSTGPAESILGKIGDPL